MQVIESGLQDTGRRLKISLHLSDRPGSLSVLLQEISSLQANVYVNCFCIVFIFLCFLLKISF